MTLAFEERQRISGATIVASDSMTNMGVVSVNLSQVIFSLGVAPEYEPYEVVESQDLGEVGPGFRFLFEIILDRRHHTDREISGDAPANLEEADAAAGRELSDTDRRTPPCIRCPT